MSRKHGIRRSADYRQQHEAEPTTEELVRMLRSRDVPEARALRLAEVNAEFEGLMDEWEPPAAGTEREKPAPSR
jgi:hypothetical protein